MILIINTVIKTVSYFLDQNPDKSIAFMGSSSSRNRLYRAVIAKLFDEKKIYLIYWGGTMMVQSNHLQ
jgi:hypothetical protein